MDVQVGYRPAQSMARVVLAAGESVLAESGALVGMSTNVAIETRSGGLLSGLKRMFGGESMFLNRFTAEAGPGEVLLAHALSGDMVVLETGPTGVFVQAGGFLASSTNVHIETKVGGLRTLFAGEGLTLLRAHSTGPGTLLLGAFGGIQELECKGDLIVDTGHLVAWEASIDFAIEKSAAGWLATLLSGEGLVCHFRGHGRVWIQSRNPHEYGRLLGGLLPSREG